jgi:tetratricopeptide (TPR) repeat protein
MSSSNTAKAGRGLITRWAIRILVPVAVLLVVGVAGTWVTWAFGAVSGVELCPETFERRSFVYYELPVIRRQVRKVRRYDMTGEAGAYLKDNKFLPSKPKGKQTWHIVHAQRGRQAWDGDAQILTNYLDAEDSDGQAVWVEWTTANPKLGSVLWPAISRLATEELYIYIPEAIELAKSASDSTTFKQQVDAKLAETFYDAAMRCQKAGNHDAAIHYFDLALQLSPGNEKFSKARSESSNNAGAKNSAQAGK